MSDQGLIKPNKFHLNTYLTIFYTRLLISFIRIVTIVLDAFG